MISWLLFACLVYLRFSTVWLTVTSIKRFGCSEKNLIMKQGVEGNWRVLVFSEGLMVAGFAFISFALLVQNWLMNAMVFCIVFILWIDFQHDWETYVILKELYKSKGFRELVAKTNKGEKE